jgi:hypothetical protein
MIALVLITLLTFVVFCLYARDMRRIARADALQLSNAQMPFLVLTQKHFEDEIHKRFYTRWAVENQGSGPALDVTIDCKYEFIEGQDVHSFELAMNPIPAGGNELLGEPRPSKERILDCQIRYTSLSGERCVTRIEMADGELVTRFEKSI